MNHITCCRVSTLLKQSISDLNIQGKIQAKPGFQPEVRERERKRKRELKGGRGGAIHIDCETLTFLF